MTLKEKLVKQGKRRWLDIGSGGVFEDGFHSLDTYPEDLLPPGRRKRYTRMDVLSVSPAELKKLGSFDLVRMQHVLEHFSLEEGKIVIERVARLLKKDGMLLLTVPDLRIHIQKYLKGEYRKWKGFAWWAHKRIPKNAPDSFYFAIFAHSMPFESHKWTYDFEGLRFLLKESRSFRNIQKLKVGDPLYSVPFTHNRPEEDLCVLAVRK